MLAKEKKRLFLARAWGLLALSLLLLLLLLLYRWDLVFDCYIFPSRQCSRLPVSWSRCHIRTCPGYRHWVSLSIGIDGAFAFLLPEFISQFHWYDCLSLAMSVAFSISAAWSGDGGSFLFLSNVGFGCWFMELLLCVAFLHLSVLFKPFFSPSCCFIVMLFVAIGGTLIFKEIASCKDRILQKKVVYLESQTVLKCFNQILLQMNTQSCNLRYDYEIQIWLQIIVGFCGEF